MAGYEVTDFLFIAQEKVQPYASKVFRITKEQMDYGWTMMEQYLNDYKEYQKGKPLSIYNSPNVVDLVLQERKMDKRMIYNIINLPKMIKDKSYRNVGAFENIEKTYM